MNAAGVQEAADHSVPVQGVPVRRVADLGAERDRRIWPERCLAEEQKFGGRVARLYSMIGVEGGVKTPLGQGTLFTAFDSGCQVLLTRGRKTSVDAGGKPYKPLRKFAVEDIEPYAVYGGMSGRETG